VAKGTATRSNHLPGLRRDSSLSKEESVESFDFTDFYPKYSILEMCIRIWGEGSPVAEMDYAAFGDKRPPI
jgi:hypothetical protein